MLQQASGEAARGALTQMSNIIHMHAAQTELHAFWCADIHSEVPALLLYEQTALESANVQIRTAWS
jgi:hypothetical protein